MLSNFEHSRLMEMVELMNEDKSRFIKKNQVLSDEDKERALEFFKIRPTLESEIHWQGKDVDVASEIIQLIDSTQEKKIKKEKEKESYRGNVKFDSNWKIFKETDSWVYAIPLNKEAAKFADVYACGGQGARWCIGARVNTQNKWDHYVNEKMSTFLMCYNKKCTISEDKFSSFPLQSIERNIGGLKYMLELQNNGNIINVIDKDDVYLATIESKREWEEMRDKYKEFPCFYTELSYDNIIEIREVYNNEHKKDSKVKKALESLESYCKKQGVPFSGLSPQTINDIWLKKLGTPFFSLPHKGISLIWENDSYQIFHIFDKKEVNEERHDLDLQGFLKAQKRKRETLITLLDDDIDDINSRVLEMLLLNITGNCPIFMVKKEETSSFLNIKISTPSTPSGKCQIRINEELKGRGDFNKNSIFFPSISVFRGDESYLPTLKTNPENFFFEWRGNTCALIKTFTQKILTPMGEYFIRMFKRDEKFRNFIMEKTYTPE